MTDGERLQVQGLPQVMVPDSFIMILQTAIKNGESFEFVSGSLKVKITPVEGNAMFATGEDLSKVFIKKRISKG